MTGKRDNKRTREEAKGRSQGDEGKEGQGKMRDRAAQRLKEDEG